MRYLLADTGLWYALFDKRDPHHAEAGDRAELLDACKLVVPWPSLYEVLRTRLVRNKPAMQLLEHYLRRPHLTYVDDAPYREDALALAFSSALVDNRPLSMIDCLNRLILSDVNIRIDGLLTFNARDFSDVCRSREIEMILQNETD